jgi:hypothetical protein
MKLCTDCKHAVLPQPPWANVQVGQKFTMLEMCGHPNASRSVVDGSLKTPCEIARGATGGLDPICGMDAALFEQREPEPPKVYFTEAMDPNKWPAAPGGICFEKYRADTGRPWWRRIFGG